MVDISDVVKESIIECIHLNLQKDDIKDDFRLVEDLAFDSIIYVQVIVTIEEKLNVDLADDVLDMKEIATFYDLNHAIEKCIG